MRAKKRERNAKKLEGGVEEEGEGADKEAMDST
jgi:hypothetical protein